MGRRAAGVGDGHAAELRVAPAPPARLGRRSCSTTPATASGSNPADVDHLRFEPLADEGRAALDAGDARRRPAAARRGRGALAGTRAGGVPRRRVRDATPPPAWRSGASPRSRTGSTPTSRSAATPSVVSELQGLVGRLPLRERLRGPSSPSPSTARAARPRRCAPSPTPPPRCARSSASSPAGPCATSRRRSSTTTRRWTSRADAEPAAERGQRRAPRRSRRRRRQGPERPAVGTTDLVGRDAELDHPARRLRRRPARRPVRRHRGRARHRQDPPRRGAAPPRRPTARGLDRGLGPERRGRRRTGPVAVARPAARARRERRRGPAGARRAARRRGGHGARPGAGRPVRAVRRRSPTCSRPPGATQPVVVLLDDLQWADDASLELLGFLAGRLRRGRAGRRHGPPARGRPQRRRDRGARRDRPAPRQPAPRAPRPRRGGHGAGARRPPSTTGSTRPGPSDPRPGRGQPVLRHRAGPAPRRGGSRVGGAGHRARRHPPADAAACPADRRPPGVAAVVGRDVDLLLLAARPASIRPRAWT